MGPVCFGLKKIPFVGPITRKYIFLLVPLLYIGVPLPTPHQLINHALYFPRSGAVRGGGGILKYKLKWEFNCLTQHNLKPKVIFYKVLTTTCVPPGGCWCALKLLQAEWAKQVCIEYLGCGCVESRAGSGHTYTEIMYSYQSHAIHTIHFISLL